MSACRLHHTDRAGLGYCTEHAEHRIGERYGLVPTRADWRAAVLAILDAAEGRPGALLLATLPRGERWLVRMCGRDVVVVWHPADALIVTVVEACRPRVAR